MPREAPGRRKYARATLAEAVWGIATTPARPGVAAEYVARVLLNLFRLPTEVGGPVDR